MRKNNKKRYFRHLQRAGRDEIEILLRRGHKKKDIAEVLGVHKSTISREVNGRKRKDGRYEASTADQKARVKRLNSKYQGMKVEKLGKETQWFIVEGLENCHSPDEIAGRMKMLKMNERAGKDAIYRWLYSVWGQRYCHLLCTKRRRRKSNKKRAKKETIPNRKPLFMRPKSPSLTHTEADTFLSPKRANTKVSGVIMVASSSKLMAGKIIPDLKPETMAEAMREIVALLGPDTLTLDNGLENRQHEEFGAATYFCNPHSPWQKPHVENAIGLLRRWFVPKGTDLSKISNQLLEEYIRILNSKWRKSLGYQSAYEAAIEHDILKTKIPARGQEQRVEKLHLRSEFRSPFCLIYYHIKSILSIPSEKALAVPLDFPCL